MAREQAATAKLTAAEAERAGVEKAARMAVAAARDSPKTFGFLCDGATACSVESLQCGVTSSKQVHALHSASGVRRLPATHAGV